VLDAFLLIAECLESDAPSCQQVTGAHVTMLGDEVHRSRHVVTDAGDRHSRRIGWALTAELVVAGLKTSAAAPETLLLTGAGTTVVLEVPK
jgi:hypothetical protein